MRLPRRYGKVGLWALFAAVQVLGVTIASHTNIHTNIWPAFGLLLLIPGIVVTFALELRVGPAIAAAVVINAAVWYFAMRCFRRTDVSGTRERE